MRLVFGMIALLGGGCSPDVQNGIGPRVPEPAIEGNVLRGSAPAIRVEVELHNVASGAQVAETRSNHSGYFMFAGVDGGLWEVRAESDLTGDFASVSRQFHRMDDDGRFRVANLDVFAHGAALVRPAAGASVPTPTPFAPLDFHWTLPAVAGAVAQVQLYDAASQGVWRSSPAAVDSARWYGYGTEGAYQGVPVGPGLYEWRIKFLFPDTTEARTERRLLRFESAP